MASNLFQPARMVFWLRPRTHSSSSTRARLRAARSSSNGSATYPAQSRNVDRKPCTVMSSRSIRRSIISSVMLDSARPGRPENTTSLTFCASMRRSTAISLDHRILVTTTGGAYRSPVEYGGRREGGMAFSRSLPYLPSFLAKAGLPEWPRPGRLPPSWRPMLSAIVDSPAQTGFAHWRGSGRYAAI
jgi:hypothetical protein